MPDLLVLNADGSTWDERNVADVLWSVPANQAQIAAWIAPGGHTFSVDPLNTDPQAVAATLTTMAQVQSWLYPIWGGSAGATLPPASASGASSSTPWGALLALGVLVVGGGIATYIALAPMENPSRCGPGINTKHHPNCRPGRPLCRYRRRDKGICTCTAYHFPHRLNSGACRTGVPDVIRKSRSYRAS